jgi:RNA polymerase primary sigma factor
MSIDPTEHLGLAGYWAGKFARHPQDFDDLFSMGVVGLLTACRKFDPERGASFATYATFWIRQSIIRHLKTEQRFIRVPEK